MRPGVGRVVDHRHEDDPRPDFQGAQHVVSLAVGQSDERKNAARFGGQTESLCLLEADWTVLAFDPDRLETDVCRQRHEQG